MSADDLVIDAEEVELPQDLPTTDKSKGRAPYTFPRPEESKPERAPLTEEQWERVLLGRKKTVVKLVTREQREWAGTNARSCGGCVHVHMHGDPRRGFCLAQEMMVGLAFPVLCREYRSAS